jgi:hypothetical protein
MLLQPSLAYQELALSANEAWGNKTKQNKTKQKQNKKTVSLCSRGPHRFPNSS